MLSAWRVAALVAGLDVAPRAAFDRKLGFMEFEQLNLINLRDHIEQQVRKAIFNGTIGGDSSRSGPAGYSFPSEYGTIYPGFPATNGVAGGVASGGGIHSDDSELIINRSTFHHNTCLGGKGGAGGSRLEAADDGGNGGRGGSAFGGALTQIHALLALTNSTFYSNSISGGSGGRVSGGQSAPASIRKWVRQALLQR